MSIPVVSFRGIPVDLREWGRVLLDLNQSIRKNGMRVFAEDQRFVNQIGTGNKQSTQSIQPVTASDSGGGLAEVAVAAHDVQYSFGTVSHNSGTISGLLNSTLYYIYADDPDYQGGALTYLATTNANNITSNSGRYYVGSVTTPAAAGAPVGGGWGGGGGGGGHPLP